jgi:uncharacterized protein (DUF433 family)
MAARTIVRHPEVLEGRWHFDGTGILVAEVVRSYWSGFAGTGEEFRFCDLSGAELAAALAFDFPPVREASVELRPALIQANCVCGESTTIVTTGDNEAEIVCPCGRAWNVHLTVEPGPTHLSRTG